MIEFKHFAAHQIRLDIEENRSEIDGKWREDKWKCRKFGTK
jgi:hypothetical protein